MATRLVRLAVSVALVSSALLIGAPIRSASPDPSTAVPSPATSAAPGSSPAASDSPTPTTLRVAGLLIEPFGMHDDDESTGYSVEIWDEIALRSGFRTELTWVDDIDQLLDAVRSGDADVGIGPVSMTPEREEGLDFTYAYSTGGLGIMVSTSAVGPLETFVDTVFRPSWLILGLVLAILIVTAGLVVWLPKRGKEGWPKDTRTGLHESAWRSARAFLNSSFGEHEPRTGLGRLAAISWIVAGIIFTSLFTAAVTSNATVSQLQGSISGPDDLNGKRILSPSEGASAEWLTGRGLPWRSVDSLDEGYELLLQGAADAIVFDQLVLRYDATTKGGGRLAVVGQAFQVDPYGFALVQGGPHREAIDTALLSMIHDGSLDALHTRWFGSSL